MLLRGSKPVDKQAFEKIDLLQLPGSYDVMDFCLFNISQWEHGPIELLANGEWLKTCTATGIG